MHLCLFPVSRTRPAGRPRQTCPPVVSKQISIPASAGEKGQIQQSTIRHSTIKINQMKKILLPDNVFKVVLNDAKKKGLTADEIVSILIQREYKLNK
jgi:hypothetical protein